MQIRRIFNNFSTLKYCKKSDLRFLIFFKHRHLYFQACFTVLESNTKHFNFITQKPQKKKKNQ